MLDERLKILRTAPENHVFCTATEEYLRGFLHAIDRVYGFKKWEAKAREKFQLRKASFDEEEYLRHAAELSLQNGIALMNGLTNVEFEKKVNPPKNVDCYYEHLGVKVALDVKCAERPNIVPDSYTLLTAGRMPPTAMKKAEDLRQALSDAPGGKQVALGKKKDNSLRDFLVDAHKKFDPNSGVSNFNGVVVGCGEPIDLMAWYHFLHSWQGLFTNTPFHDKREYSLVDAVILSNLKDIHVRRSNERAWTLQDAFMLPVLNPYSKRASLNADCALATFQHHMSAFQSYLNSKTQGRDGHLWQEIGVLHYIEEVLPVAERTRYFGPRKAVEA
jgi:hypothetical protein